VSSSRLYGHSESPRFLLFVDFVVCCEATSNTVVDLLMNANDKAVADLSRDEA
jgi:hypothetical protein